MRLVSPLLKHVVYPGLSRSGYLRRAGAPGPAVVTYHGVLPAGYEVIDPDLDGNLVSAEAFRRQLQFLTEHYNVISPEEFLRWCNGGQKLPPRSVLLTCDDGLRNALADMLPILQEFRLSCLFFVTGASLRDTPSMLWHDELYLMFLAEPGNIALELPEADFHATTAGRKEKRATWWELVKRLSRFEADQRRKILESIRAQLGLSEQWNSGYLEDPVLGRRFLALTLHEVFHLEAAGMCMGAHSMSHPILSQAAAESAWSEIWESRRSLEQILGKPVWALAYPFGDSSTVTSRELQIAKRAGFQSAFLNVGGGFRISGFQIRDTAIARDRRNEYCGIRSSSIRISWITAAMVYAFR